MASCVRPTCCRRRAAPIATVRMILSSTTRPNGCLRLSSNAAAATTTISPRIAIPFMARLTSLATPQVATCASCHGSHEILPASNPVSKVSAQNRLATCRTCHPKANVNFALYDPRNANRHRRDGGEFAFYRQFMDFLLIGVFGFFGAPRVCGFTVVEGDA